MTSVGEWLQAGLARIGRGCARAAAATVSALVRFACWCWRTGQSRLLSAGLGALALYVGWLAILPTPLMLTTVSAQTERVKFTVADRRLATVPIAAARAASDGGLDGECVQGALAPNVSASIAYERSIGGPITVILESGDAVLEAAADGSARKISGPAEFVPDDTCPGTAPPRFPVWGQAQIGEETKPTTAGGRVQTGLLLSATLQIQARAIEHWAVPLRQRTVYSVADLDLPSGTRIANVSVAGERPESWWGTVYIDPQKPALTLQAATEAQVLSIYRPGRTDPDVVTVTALSQLFDDPNLVRIQLFALVVVAIIQTLSAILSLARNG